MNVEKPTPRLLETGVPTTGEPQSAAADASALDSDVCRIGIATRPADRDVCQQLLQELLGLNSVDAGIALRSFPGVIPVRLIREKAEMVAAALRDQGISAQVISAGPIPELSSAVLLHHARVRPEGLVVVGWSGQIESVVPWESVIVISLGMVPRAGGVRQVEHAGVPVPGRLFRTEQLQVSSGSELVVWIIAADPVRVWRIDHQQFNYESLGEEMSTSAANNMRHWLKYLVTHASKADVTPATRHYLEHGASSDAEFDSVESLRRVTEYYALVKLSSLRSRGERTAEPVGKGHRQAPHLTDRERRRLSRQFTELLAWCDEVDQLGFPRFGELGQRVRELRDCMSPLLVAEQPALPGAPPDAPSETVRERSSRPEPATLLAQVDDLIFRLSAEEPQFNCWRSAVSQLRTVLSELGTYWRPSERAADQPLTRPERPSGDAQSSGQ
jgi:hypothetical protein